MIEMETIVTRHFWADKEGLCPVCGSKMRQTDSAREDKHVFTWFECTKEGCDGQWLQKKLVAKEVA
jgi:hypothetical protein